MKKRSLVAAIAMLIVSAIVLTSSTYAWFASNTNANIEAFTATVGNAAGSVYISTDGANWRSTLSAADFTSGIAAALTPVSYDKTSDHFYGGSFAATGGIATAFNGTATADTNYYTAITVYIYTETAGTVTVTPTLGDIGNTPYVYASAKSDTAQVILGTGGDKYFPAISSAASTATDNNPQNGIIDAAEATAGTNISLGDEVAVTGGGLTLNMEAGEANKQQVTFYVWAEGNDSNCFGTSSGSPSFNVGFAFAEV